MMRCIICHTYLGVPSVWKPEVWTTLTTALDELATPKVMFGMFFVGPDELAKRYKIVNGSVSVSRRDFSQVKNWIRQLRF